VKVPVANRLGGDGADLQPLVDAMRVASASLAVGVGRAAFEYARDYAKERTAFGVPIATKQAIAFMLSNMAIEIDAMRLLAWEAAWRLDKGLPAVPRSLARQAVRRRRGPQDRRQRGPGARRPRLHPRPPGRALPARRARFRHPRRPRHRLTVRIRGVTTMIDFELSDGMKNMQTMTHMLAEQAMRPISREYDEKEHEKPWDFLNMMWGVSRGASMTGDSG
jgi:hypothetical protein